MSSKGLIIAIISFGVGLGTLIVGLHQTTSAAIRSVQRDVDSLHTEVRDVRSDVADLRERMARLEGRMDSLEGVIVQVFAQ